MTGVSEAVRKSVFPGASTKPRAVRPPEAEQASKQFPARAIPKVRSARRADRLASSGRRQLVGTCAADTVDLGSWCLMNAPYGITKDEIGKNNYFFATQKCAELGGYVPTAAQLVGAAPRVKLASTIGDSQLTASIDLDPTDGLKDRREMSSTLVTTTAGSSAAGSIGVSEGSKGDPKQGEPDPLPQPANPSPDTLQYVTVYDNGDKGGFGGAQAGGPAGAVPLRVQQDGAGIGRGNQLRLNRSWISATSMWRSNDEAPLPPAAREVELGRPDARGPRASRWRRGARRPLRC